VLSELIDSDYENKRGDIVSTARSWSEEQEIVLAAQYPERRCLVESIRPIARREGCGYSIRAITLWNADL
jgi:hypothetical protein